MDRYYLIWGDYDGYYVDVFEDEKLLLLKLNQVMASVEKKEYGTYVERVIFGEELELESREVKTQWFVKKPS